MKRILSMLLCTALLLALAGCGGGGEAVNVQAVSLIASAGSVGFVERCAGKVVSGQTAKINRDSDKKVLELAVKEGDMVNEGDLLFSYDAAAMELDLEKLRLEYKTLENTIVSATQEIEELERQKSMVYISNQLSYTIQIDSKQADIREAEYNKAIKDREIQSLEKALEATDVTAPIGGRIMSVNEEGSSDSGMMNGGMDGNSSAYITIMDISSYRVQGNINELNLYSLTEGLEVLVRSRMEPDRIWHGTVSSIDWENPVTGSDNNMYYYAGPTDEMTSSSKYPFYVELENIDGLVLGQHVIIEPDNGQGSLGEGIWLPSYYITDAEGAPFVWAANPKDRLEKRSITLGEHNEELDLWLVTEGLALTDFLAFPEEGLSAGRSVSYFSEENFASAGDVIYDEGYGEFFDGSGEPFFEESGEPFSDESGEMLFDEGMLPDEEPIYEDVPAEAAAEQPAADEMPLPIAEEAVPETEEAP